MGTSAWRKIPKESFAPQIKFANYLGCFLLPRKMPFCRGIVTDISKFKMWEKSYLAIVISKNRKIHHFLKAYRLETWMHPT